MIPMRRRGHAKDNSISRLLLLFFNQVIIVNSRLKFDPKFVFSFFLFSFKIIIPCESKSMYDVYILEGMLNTSCNHPISF